MTNIMDTLIFWGAAAVSIIGTLFVILGKNPFTAVLYLILSLFGISMMFYTLGAPFLAAMEIIVYAGAIMVLFLFVVQMLSPGATASPAPDMMPPKPLSLVAPGVLSLILLSVLVGAIWRSGSLVAADHGHVITTKVLGQVLFQQHYLGVELASLILLIGIVGGMHLGRAASIAEETELDVAIR